MIAPDDTVTIRVGQSEMGQGVITSCAKMLAEELECDWSKVRAEYVSVNRHFRENRVYKRLVHHVEQFGAPGTSLLAASWRECAGAPDGCGGTDLGRAEGGADGER